MAGAGKRLLEKPVAYRKHKPAETNIRGKDRRESMFDGYADSAILIGPYPNRTGVSARKQVGVVTASDASTNGGGF